MGYYSGKRVDGALQGGGGGAVFVQELNVGLWLAASVEGLRVTDSLR